MELIYVIIMNCIFKNTQNHLAIEVSPTLYFRIRSKTLRLNNIKCSKWNHTSSFYAKI